MLEGKKGIIFGIANDHSIAWGIAKKLSEYNAKLAVTYQNDTFFKIITNNKTCHHPLLPVSCSLLDPTAKEGTQVNTPHKIATQPILLSDGKK